MKAKRMQLSELVQIDNRFEKSINLILDLGSHEKVALYIPTRSSVKLLRDLVKNIETSAANRANILTGPYGKGKSHLLLVLMSLLSGEQNEETDELLRKVEPLDSEAAEEFREVYGNRKLLPVIVNTNSGNLNQAFIRSLEQALKRNGLNDVVPNTYFSEADHKITQWKTHFPDTYKGFEKNLKSGWTLKTIVSGLKKSDYAALDEFRRVYPTVTSGSEFNPQVDDEVISVYSSVNRMLCSRHGYDGIYIVFDEFSKYIEGHSPEGFSQDMKVLQDICEMAEASRDEQIHLTCVAHKAIRSYGDALSKKVQNAFRGVEGRLHEIPFAVSSQNNYELIADAIRKTPAFADYADTEEFKAYLDESYQIPEFSALFEKDDFDEIIGKGVYPLTPLTALLVLNLSERIAQNERTIFTFLTGQDMYSLATYIQNSEETDFAGADLVYDYFSSLIEEDKTTSVHAEWVKSEYTLSQTDDDIEKKIIKTIAVIRMLNRGDDVPANDFFLSLASGLPFETVKEKIESLQEKDLIVFKRSGSGYEFRNGILIDLEKEVADTALKYYAGTDVTNVLNDSNRSKYILPKKFNQDHLMTRYFRVHFMSAAAFSALSSVSYLKCENEPDGYLLIVFCEGSADIELLKAHIADLNDPAVLVGFTVPEHIYENDARMLLAAERLLGDKEFIAENAVASAELNALKSELCDSLNEYAESFINGISEFFSKDGRVTIASMGLNRTISDLCERVYYQTPIINQELVNRHHVSAQISKARNIIVDDILNGRLMEKYETLGSAEATIYRAVFVHAKDDPYLQMAKDLIGDFIHESKGKKASFSGIVSLLTKPPFGMRKGIIPFLIAEKLTELEDMPVIYIGKKEVSIDAPLLSNILSSPESYSLYVETETGEKLEYIEGLEKLFSDYGPYCREITNRNRLLKIKCFMQAWFRVLPQSAIVFKEPDHEGQAIKTIQAFRKPFFGEPNPRELIFDQLPKILGTNNFKKTLDAVKEMKYELEFHVQRMKDKAEGIVRDTLGLSPTDDFCLSMKQWYGNLPDTVKNAMLPASSQRMLNCFRELNGANVDDIIEKLSKACTSFYVEDWSDCTSDEFSEGLSALVSDINAVGSRPADSGQKIAFATSDGIEERYYDFDPDNMSTSGHFFESALEDMIEEYGESLDNNEKIGILLNMVKKLMG